MLVKSEIIRNQRLLGIGSKWVTDSIKPTLSDLNSQKKLECSGSITQAYCRDAPSSLKSNGNMQFAVNCQLFVSVRNSKKKFGYENFHEQYLSYSKQYVNTYLAENFISCQGGWVVVNIYETSPQHGISAA